MSFSRKFRFLLFSLLIGLFASLPFTCRANGSNGFSRSNAVVQYTSRIWQSDEGLPQSGVLATAQTSDGYLWVGTTKGLTRFDGNQFKVFDSYTPDGLKSSFIAVLRAGRDGSLWIGTAGGGLTHLKDGVFKAVPLGDTERMNSVKAILETRDGSIWVGTLGGLFRLKNEVVTAHLTTKDGLADDMVRALCEVDNGLWIGTSAGINDWKNGAITTVPAGSGKLIRTILRDSRGIIWAGFQGGLAMITNVTNGAARIFTKADGLPDNNVALLYEDHRGAVWIGTFAGLGRWIDGKLRVEQDDRGYFYDQVNSIIEDQENDIWLGCRDGLQELRLKNFTTFSRQNGLSRNNIVSVMEDRHGVIWAGSWGGGLNRLEDGIVTSYKEEDAEGHDSESVTDLILALGEDQDGHLLVGTDYDGGMFKFDQGIFSRLGLEKEPLTNSVVRVIYRDQAGETWAGTSTGLISLNRQKRFLETSVIRCLLQDHSGDLWIGTGDGLFCRSKGEIEKRHNELHDSITALHEDAEHNLWVGTAHSGLYRVKDGHFSNYNLKTGLLSDEIFEILEDDDGWLWMSCSKGIFRVRKRELEAVDQKKAITVRCLVYGKPDGMETVQCSGVAKPGAWKDRDGRLWFATTKGVVMTDPKMGIGSNDRPPPVEIEDVWNNHRHVSPSQEIAANSPGQKTNTFVLPPGSRNLEFHYSALSFQAPQKIHYKYRLEGIDREWVEVPRHVAYYSQLPPGRYVFRVIASNNDSVWNKTGASIVVVLEPHYWQRWWFKTLVALAAAGLLAGAVRLFTRRKLRRELLRLEQERAIEQERTRIARDMHDEIGAKLTKISFLGAAAKRKISLPEEAGAQIDKMSVTARDVIRSLDEIVWALNPAHDSVEDLANYLSRNATEFFDNSPIACHLDIPDELPSLRLGMDVRHNLILASREALNNVLKHSAASTVNLKVSLDDEMFVVEISDNGRGFALQKIDLGGETKTNGSVQSGRIGNGLANMRHRLESIGGSCRVESAEKHGTIIKFCVSLNGKPNASKPQTNGASQRNGH